MRLLATLALLCCMAAAPALAQVNLLASNPLLVAAYKGDAEETKRLLKAGRSPETTDNEARTALIWASVVGHVDTVGVILEFKPRLDHRDELGNTALFYAADRGPEGVVARLVVAGADANVENGQGMAPLMAAARNGHVVVARPLIDAGADVNQTDYTGRTVLDWARGGSASRLGRLLRQAGAR